MVSFVAVVGLFLSGQTKLAHRGGAIGGTGSQSLKENFYRFISQRHETPPPHLEHTSPLIRGTQKKHSKKERGVIGSSLVVRPEEKNCQYWSEGRVMTIMGEFQNGVCFEMNFEPSKQAQHGHFRIKQTNLCLRTMEPPTYAVTTHSKVWHPRQAWPWYASWRVSTLSFSSERISTNPFVFISSVKNCIVGGTPGCDPTTHQ